MSIGLPGHAASRVSRSSRRNPTSSSCRVTSARRRGSRQGLLDANDSRRSCRTRLANPHMSGQQRGSGLGLATAPAFAKQHRVTCRWSRLQGVERLWSARVRLRGAAHPKARTTAGPPTARRLVGGGTSASTTWMQCSHQFHTAASWDSHIVEAECSYEGTDASHRGLSGVRWSSGPPGRYASRARANSARG